MGALGDARKFTCKEKVIEAAQSDARQLKDRVDLASGIEIARCTGHFMRRSGIKDLARRGLSRDSIKWFARHSSDAVDGCIEKAMEEAPLNDRRVVQ